MKAETDRYSFVDVKQKEKFFIVFCWFDKVKTAQIEKSKNVKKNIKRLG